ncbi:porin family protein [Roseivirga sp. BDSF3-8]|uniref:porin family protein n=1 Tax=Roseivirga sp. BDSF3-8 TaxID=3241598 RepID=UPI00353274A4
MNKKLLFAGIPALFFLAFATAQSMAQVIWNPQAGVLITHYSDEPTDVDIDDGVGFQLGSYVRLRVTDNVYLQPGLFLQRTDAEFAGEVNGITDEDDINTTSLKVPLYLGFYLGKAGPLRLRLAGGVAGKYLTGVKDNNFSLDREQFNDFNWSVNIGAGVDLLLITLDIEYDLGVSPTFESISEAKTRLLMVSAGLKF